MQEIFNLVVVLVLYKTKLSDSVTFQSLKTAAFYYKHSIFVMVYDNSPEPCMLEQFQTDGNMTIQYIHNSSNPGLSLAYNKGITIAKGKSVKWILLLDQDTHLSKDYLSVFFNSVYEKLFENAVCALPKVVSMDEGNVISPIRIYFGAIFRPLKVIKPGISKETVTGINSGTFLSVAFIDELGGFSSQYKLDMLDHWYFSEIAKAKQKVFILSSVIRHNLSINFFEREVTIARYKDILNAEKKFATRSFLNYIIFRLRLIKRLKQQFYFKDKTFLKLTFKYLRDL
jgi:GT2 family glycosyltransferase